MEEVAAGDEPPADAALAEVLYLTVCYDSLHSFIVCSIIIVIVIQSYYYAQVLLADRAGGRLVAAVLHQ